MRVLNLTPHDVHVLNDDGSTLLTYPKSGQQVRLISKPQIPVDCDLEQVPVVSAQSWSNVDQSIKIDPNVTHLLVSMPVGEFLARSPISNQYWNYTIIGPDTGPQGAVRDQTGRIVGTRRLVLYTRPRYSGQQC
jgi:hypothetical protein